MPGRPPDNTRWDGISHARLDSTTVEDDPHWNGGARKYSRWHNSWEPLCPYISCEQIDSMLAEGGVCKTARKYGPCPGCFHCSRMFCTMCRHLDKPGWRVAQRFEDKWHEGVLNPMRYGTLRTWWSLHYEVHYEDGQHL